MALTKQLWLHFISGSLSSGLSYSKAILSQNYCWWKPVSGLNSHAVSCTENKMSLFSSLKLGFLPKKIRKKNGPDGECLILSADLGKFPWNLHGWCGLVQTDKWVISLLIALISGFRDAQLCCSKSFIKNLWGGKRRLHGPVWFHYLWQNTQMEQSGRGLRLLCMALGWAEGSDPLRPITDALFCQIFSYDHESQNII